MYEGESFARREPPTDVTDGWYRFQVGQHVSHVGEGKTFPRSAGQRTHGDQGRGELPATPVLRTGVLRSRSGDGTAPRPSPVDRLRPVAATFDPSAKQYQASGYSFAHAAFNEKNVRAARVLRWEFRPGSARFLAWTDQGSGATSDGSFQLGRDFGRLLRRTGDERAARQDHGWADAMMALEQPTRRGAVLGRPAIRMVITFAAIVVIALPILAGVRTARLHGMPAAIAHLLAGLGAWAVYLISVKVLERRTVRELSIRDLLPQLTKGFVIGGALFSATILVLWLTRAYDMLGVNPARALATVLVNALGAGLLEEVAVRGALFRNLEEWLGTWVALSVSALIFGLLHAANSGANWRDLTGVALQGGVLLAAVYVYARQLWVCIGLHAAWNFMDGGVFGASGGSHSLLSAQMHGPDWLTGGSSGTDASIVALVICLAATIQFLVLARRRGHLRSRTGVPAARRSSPE